MNTKDILPNMWIEIGNGFSACIKSEAEDKWEVWVVGKDDRQFRSAWNLASEEDAARNLTEVVAPSYGDERIFTTSGL